MKSHGCHNCVVWFEIACEENLELEEHSAKIAFSILVRNIGSLKSLQILKLGNFDLRYVATKLTVTDLKYAKLLNLS